MGLLCLICVWHAVVMVINESYSQDTADYCDKIALGVLGGTYILFHVVYIVLVTSMVSTCVWHNKAPK